MSGNADLNTITSDEEFYGLIHTCCLIKTKVVQKDELDTGYRNLLNFGHTFGHAIEKVSGLSEINHGMAVAVGMMMAIETSIIKGFAKESLRNDMIELYKILKLPYELPCSDKYNGLVEVMKFDKKFSSSKNKFILIKDINKPVFAHNIDDDILKKVIKNNISGV